MLERLHHRSAVATTGQRVIEMVREAETAGDACDVVLMDVQLPQMDGMEATRRLRAAGVDAARLPIIAVTANAYQTDVDECLAAGMQGHLAKPVNLAALQAGLEDVVAVALPE